ncbi:MAG: excinuclease ABC subunit UvrA [Kiritimatiellia bacterium]
MTEDIIITGARQNNLKNIDVRIPRNSLSVITGLSGSGKSSLAFDTLYAEGQRRYVESLSAYARQFLDQLQKPDVEHIEGLSPAIAIEQRASGSNPRSIVATVTEIHDYLRLLWGNIGHAHCPQCGKEVHPQSAEQIVDQLLKLPEGTKLILLAPLVHGRKGRQDEIREQMQKQGYVRARVDGVMVDVETEWPELDKKCAHTIAAVIDRLVLKAGLRTRLTDSIEQALRASDGQVEAEIVGGTSTLYSEKNACADCGLSFDTLKPRNFSFNAPYGACPTCSGLGALMVFDEDLVVPDKTLPYREAVAGWRRAGHHLLMYYNWLLRAFAESQGIDIETPYEKLPAKFRKDLMHGTGERTVELRYMEKGQSHLMVKPFEGVLPNLQRRYTGSDNDDTREALTAFLARQLCPDCKGARLRPESRACTVGGYALHEVMHLSAREALRFFDTLAGECSGTPSKTFIPLVAHEKKIATEILIEIRKRLGFLVDVGLDYLSLDRESSTLSGGEMQRIRLASQIGSGLVGVLYVLDEPTIGLHSRDNARLIAMLQKLQQRGNTVVVVEHDEEMIRCADYIVDMGPGAGRLGGEVVYQGTIKGLLKHRTSLTSAYLSGRLSVPVPCPRTKPGRAWITLEGCTENNLKNLSVRLPLGCFICVTGVSGSGKSTLIDNLLRKILAQHFYHSREKPGAYRKISGLKALDKMIEIDQSPIGRTPRSNPVTYTGCFTAIRELFASTPAAKMRGYKPGRFSFNVKGGRCEVCQGDGMKRLEMHFLPDIYVPCEQCSGTRYNHETLEVRYKDKTIADVLDMTVEDALVFFKDIPAIANKLTTIVEVGLGYIKLGQSATTLSGGEAQRIKLATELSKRATGKTLYILDEPTTGLHFADVHKLLALLLRLRDQGNTVIVIEHNLDVIKSADWILDLGPEGGDRGGTLVAEGTPEQVAQVPESFTGQFLAPLLTH